MWERSGERLCLHREQWAALLQQVAAAGYTLIGPRQRSRTIAYGVLDHGTDLPTGLGDRQGPGTYRLTNRGDAALFGHRAPQDSWKQFLYVPQRRLWRARREGRDLAVLEEARERPRLALIGVRPCDLQAIAVQDLTFLDGPFVDADYRARREGLFTVAVHCVEPGETCFCASMGTGPRATRGFDLALTELLDAGGHRFLVEVGTEAGARMLAKITAERATERDAGLGEGLLKEAARKMGRTLEAEDLPELLARNLEHPRWDDVAQRCLACTNCTLVCPTCFCGNIEDRSSLSGREAERVQRWDSCYTLDHSRLHGGPVRASHRARYRQWLTHKVGTWVAQFGVSGCVGCGRCITWCPVGIDLTEELGAIRASDGALA
ncbi:MAG: 4Fe-4S dicluster domain-containing protein [Deltaproteobacteria bacterium]|nr:4Fe-4S dicluster domain-containing protein [Deltaproteobacteria bacterium]